MRVLLLAAGLGTRLRPLTDSIPKCLVPIGGKPLLQIWLERLSKAGFGPFLINTHYLHEQVEAFIEKSQFKDQVTLVYEPELLGTAGTLIKNVDFFKGEDGMVLHADNYCMADLEAFRDAHKNRPEGCEITMMTFRTNDPKSCGIVELDERGVVVAFHEKVDDPPGDLANGAVYIFSSEFVQRLGRNFFGARDLTKDIVTRYLDKIFGVELDGFFVDVGTEKNYAKALGWVC